MNVVRACVTGVDKILENYDLMSQGLPYYSVWYGKVDRYFQFNEDDAEKGRSWLSDNLQMAADQGDNSQYYLKIHPKSETFYKRSSDDIACFPFRLNPLPGQAEVTGYQGGYSSAAGSQISAILEKINDRLDNIENGGASTEKVSTMDYIAGLIDHPNIGPAIGQTLAQLLPKIISFIPGLDLASQNNAMPAGTWPASQNYAMPPAINGVPGSASQNNARGSGNKNLAMTEEETDEKVNQALDRLEPFCDLAGDLTLLADMAEKNPQVFQMMLSTLRAQK